MTVISPPSRSRRNYRKLIALAVAIAASCTFAVHWTLSRAHGYHKVAQMMELPPHINYFDKGETGYRKEHYCIDNSDREECCSEDQCNMFVNRSTLYSECCNHVHNTDEKTVKRGRQHSHLLPLLITSAPRSGTRFIQQLLTRVGMSGLTTDTHSPQHRGIVSWKHVFDDDHYKVGNGIQTHLYKSKFRVIWHLVRDPLRSLTSLAFTEPLLENSRASQEYIEYISKHIHLSSQTELRELFHITDEEWEMGVNGTMQSEKMDQFLIYRGMEIYLHWHGFINYLNVPIFRLEDLSVQKNVTVLDEVFNSVGIKPPPQHEVMSFLNAQEEEQNRRRRLLGWDSSPIVHKQLHKNERDHRETLTWSEVCNVDQRKARAMLQMSQSFGYYANINAEVLCK